MMSVLLAVLLLFIVAGSSSAKKEASLLIVASGETHAMLEACDCEHEPGGGVTRRATLVKRLRQKQGLILCDAGGFSGGGIYDDYTLGREADSLRTLQMIGAMGVMRYDAVAIGDDDLQYGGAWLVAQAAAATVPLVSANCIQKKTGTYLTAPYRVVNRNGITVGITAVCTSERLFSIDTTITILSPDDALRKIWKELCAKTDLQIILSHTGQEVSRTIAAAFPECDLLVNGHRKNGSTPSIQFGVTPALQFGFQGKSLSGLSIQKTDTAVRVSDARWFDVTPELAEDAAVADVLAKKPVAVVSGSNRYDLYIMSLCPYGLEALKAFSEASLAMPELSWHVWFIGTVQNDTDFVSLHGAAEVADEMEWLALRELYPQYWLSFCAERIRSTGSSRTIAQKLGADGKRMDGWIRANGTAKLREHYRRSMRLSIDASPTLLVNNRSFSRPVTTTNILRFVCRKNSDATVCDSLPECSEDIDCTKKGKHGACSSNGTCTFSDAVEFSFTVVTADSTVQHPETMAIATTKELFPGATVTVVRMSSPKGKKLIQRYRPNVLPLYLFGAAVEHDVYFKRIEEGLVRKQGMYMFQPGVVPANYILSRSARTGTLALYLDPFFKGASGILQMVLDDSSYAQKIVIKPMFYHDPSSTLPGSEAYLRQEEAHRWLVLGSTAKNKQAYLRAYCKNPGSSWWTERLTMAAMSVDSLAARAAHTPELLSKHWKSIKSAGMREPVLLLKDNVEMISVGGEREFRRLLQQLTDSITYR